MKIRRKLVIAAAITLAIVAVLAATSWVLRNSIVERLSAPTLAKYGLTITNVSLDALARDAASVSYLELEHENGARISIDDLKLPIRALSAGAKMLAARRVTIGFPAEGDAEPLGLAKLIEQVLSLPAALPATVISVEAFQVESYPALRDLRWASTEGRQELSASQGVLHLSVQIAPEEDEHFEVTTSLDLRSINRPAQSIKTVVHRTDKALLLSGTAALDLAAIGMTASAVAASFGNNLAGIEIASGAAAVEVSGTIPYERNDEAVIEAQVIPSAAFEFAYSVKSGIVNVVSVRSAGPIRLRATYPEIRWSVSEERASLLMSYEEWNDMSVTISNLSCGNGPSCFMNMKLALVNADFTLAKAKRLELTGANSVEFDDTGITVSVRPDAGLSLAGFSFFDTEMAGFTARLRSPATLRMYDSGWQLATESADIKIESLALGEALTFTAPISLRKLIVDYSDQAFAMKAFTESPTSRLTWQELAIALPGFKGAVNLRNDILSAVLSTAGMQQDAAIRAQHDLDAGTGKISMTDGALSFAAKKLSRRVSPWPHDWDITSGTLSWHLQFGWQLSASGLALDGRSSFQLLNLAGAYGDTAFTGLSTNLTGSFVSAAGFEVDPSTIEIALLEIGLPVENISADYVLDPDNLSVDVKNLRMHAFGGVVTADPFKYELASERNSLLLRAESIELVELLTLEEFEAVQLTGRIGAELPVTIEGTQVSILDGSLTGEAPGGVIRYRPEIIPDNDRTTSIGRVTRALSNFEYETLTSSVAYSNDGDLVLKMRLTGRNPDLEGGRPVVLNLGIENNIPEMLRSLQATRAVEEVLERRVRR